MSFGHIGKDSAGTQSVHVSAIAETFPIQFHLNAAYRSNYGSFAHTVGNVSKQIQTTRSRDNVNRAPPSHLASSKEGL